MAIELVREPTHEPTHEPTRKSTHELRLEITLIAHTEFGFLLIEHASLFSSYLAKQPTQASVDRKEELSWAITLLSDRYDLARLSSGS